MKNSESKGQGLVVQDVISPSVNLAVTIFPCRVSVHELKMVELQRIAALAASAFGNLIVKIRPVQIFPVALSKSRMPPPLGLTVTPKVSFVIDVLPVPLPITIFGSRGILSARTRA